MPPATTPGKPSAAFAQFFANGTNLRRNISDSALPFTPIIRFRWVKSFGASLIRYPLRPVDLLASLADLTGLPPANGDLYARAFSGLVTFPLSSITTVATEQASPAGLAPTGTSTSIAALCY